MSKKIYGIPVSTPINPAKIDPVVPDDKLANAVSAYMDANPVTPGGIGARPDTWTPTAEEVGATPASHAEDILNPHKVTIAQIGAAPATHAEDKGNPHAVTAAQVGLGNVNNTADKDKPVSTAQEQAIAEAKKAGTDAQTAAANAHTAANNAQTSAANAHTAIDNHKEDKNNPHAVTCEQIGAATKAYADTKTVMTMVWENASPTSTMGSQVISLDLSQFTHIAVEYNNGTSSAEANSPIGTVTCPIGKTLYLYQAGVAARFIYTGKTQIHVGSATSNKDSNLIPLRFYGIKIAGAFEEVLPSAEGVDF